MKKTLILVSGVLREGWQTALRSFEKVENSEQIWCVSKHIETKPIIPNRCNQYRLNRLYGALDDCTRARFNQLHDQFEKISDNLYQKLFPNYFPASMHDVDVTGLDQPNVQYYTLIDNVDPADNNCYQQYYKLSHLQKSIDLEKYDKVIRIRPDYILDKYSNLDIADSQIAIRILGPKGGVGDGFALGNACTMKEKYFNVTGDDFLNKNINTHFYLREHLDKENINLYDLNDVDCIKWHIIPCHLTAEFYISFLRKDYNNKTKKYLEPVADLL